MSSIQKSRIEQQVDLAVAAARLTQYLADLFVEPFDVTRSINQTGKLRKKSSHEFGQKGMKRFLPRTVIVTLESLFG